MIEFGKTLRAAREAKGYTVVQLGDLTHLAPTTIEDLENENFSRIAAPIYGRGFVKLYCTAVGLDAKPLIDEFMEIYQGNRNSPIRELPEEGESESPDIPAPAQPAAPEPPLPNESPTSRPLPIQSTFDEPPPVAEQTFAKTEAEPKLSRYATPLRTPAVTNLPPAFWRVGMLALVGLAFLVLLGFGVRALYRATGPKAEAPRQSLLPEPTKASASATPASERTPRTPIEVPPLYVD